jgi:hypothetical protein
MTVLEASPEARVVQERRKEVAGRQDAMNRLKKVNGESSDLQDRTWIT